MKKLLGVVVLLLTVLPVQAIDFDYYGSLKMGLWWEKDERYFDDTVSIDTVMVMVWDTTINDSVLVPDTIGAELDKDSIPVYQNNFLPFGYVGFKTKGDKIGTCLEIGVTENVFDATLSGVTGQKFLGKKGIFVYLRKWYFEWYMNDVFTLLCGQDYGPTTMVMSNQVFMDHNSLTNIGCVYTYRSPMVKLSMNAEVNESMHITGELAARRNDTITIAIHGQEHYTEIETRAPKGEVGLGINYDNDFFGIKANVAGGFQRFYSILRTGIILPVDSSKIAIDGWLISGMTTIKIGPVKLGASFGTGQNLGVYGVRLDNPWLWRIGSTQDPDIVETYYPFHEPVRDPVTNVTKRVLRNSYKTEAGVVLNVKPWEFVSLEAGGGMITGSHEYDYLDALWVDRYAWYFQIEAEILEGLYFTPELGQFIWGADARKGGRISYLGLMGRFEF